MQNVERIIWFGSIIFMVAILTIVNLCQAQPEIKAPKITPIHTEMLVEIKGVDGYSFMTDLNERYVTIAKNDANLSLEVQVDPEKKTLSEFRREITQGVFQGPGEWQYYLEESWDSNPETKTIANIRKVFFTEKEGVLVQAYQYDYTGGKYDQEIYTILNGVTLQGSHW